MRRILIVSDGTGGTARRAVDAAMTQFSGHEAGIETISGVRTVDEIRDITVRASRSGALIVHTLVTVDLRQAMLREARLHDVGTIDLMGPLLDRISQKLEVQPEEKPGLFGQLNDAYFRRIECMEFAFHHDDGARHHELGMAEIVLVGVSRTFKTPLSIYLAYRGWFVANVPIVLGLEPPSILDRLPADRVIGLTTNAPRLSRLRRAREQFLRSSVGDYAELRHVRRELEYSRFIFEREPSWPTIDVTGKPVEEIAGEIVATITSES